MKPQRQVTRFLVARGVALAGAGVTPETLTQGQVGVFNANTGLSIAAGTTATPFFLAVGTANGYRRSAGKILNANIRTVNVQCPVAAVNQVDEIANLCADCATDYAIKFDITASGAWHEYGMQPFMKTVTYTTECCNDGSASCLDLAVALRDAINADPMGLFTAKLIDPADTGNAAAVAIDESVWVGDCPFLQIVGNTPALIDFCGIPETYTSPTGLSFVTSIQGFDCCTTAVTTIVNSVFPQGATIEVKYDEWFNAGNAEARPYRLTDSGVTTQIALNTESGKSYAVLSLDYDDPHETAGTLHSEPKSVQLAIPCDAAVLATVGNVLDTLFTPATDADLTACDCS